MTLCAFLQMEKSILIIIIIVFVHEHTRVESQCFSLARHETELFPHPLFSFIVDSQSASSLFIQSVTHTPTTEVTLCVLYLCQSNCHHVSLPASSCDDASLYIYSFCAIYRHVWIFWPLYSFTFVLFCFALLLTNCPSVSPLIYSLYILPLILFSAQLVIFPAFSRYPQIPKYFSACLSFSLFHGLFFLL